MINYKKTNETGRSCLIYARSELSSMELTITADSPISVLPGFLDKEIFSIYLKKNRSL